ncbi:LOW QUALITY PROTEIN: mitochondrial import inner membrane translocase subunit Tim10 B [Echeneis naucrates]|uniref:LOW QUALITY PROTEIN: mitochondrial import inner membrane translocase subunit Tim10 B n=1 Tax=Echeneis naucrates TaxID=173247 RepID=UPI0011134129|nr:LOW QUALITY PROTEIN: mitochondrial import inner membrane translocase subunit Tim10 B [Echeneis naucrates]
MDADQQLRNLRDFLLVYNRMTEICFQRCTSNFNYRNLTMDEERCVDSCAGKLIRSNHRLMGTYVQLMPRMVQRRMEEMESKAAENAKAAEAATAASNGPLDTIPPSPIISSPSPQSPVLLNPLAPDVAPGAHGSVLEPARLDIPIEFDAAVSKSTPATEVNLSAPATETVDSSAFNKDGSGTSHTAVFSQPPLASAQAKPKSSSENSLVSTVAVPTVLKSTERLSGQEKFPPCPATNDAPTGSVSACATVL